MFSIQDGRPHAQVTIGGQTIEGLLDSGANISCFGDDAEEVVRQLGLKIHNIESVVNTADGAAQSIIGYVDTPVTYGTNTKTVRFYVIPSLKQKLYLGYDFWKLFGLAPVEVSELNVPIDPNFHILSPLEQSQLDKVKILFPSSDIEGLGRTSLLQHHIDTTDSDPIKQRFYAVSPAVQALAEKELDRMIELGVVEESQSPWSSPVVLIRKDTGKNRLCLDSRALSTPEQGFGEGRLSTPNHQRPFKSARRYSFHLEYRLKRCFLANRARRSLSTENRFHDARAAIISVSPHAFWLM